MNGLLYRRSTPTLVPSPTVTISLLNYAGHEAVGELLGSVVSMSAGHGSCTRSCNIMTSLAG
jgi:hypothetical protein